jgi:hypothetical protein
MHIGGNTIEKMGVRDEVMYRKEAIIGYLSQETLSP